MSDACNVTITGTLTEKSPSQHVSPDESRLKAAFTVQVNGPRAQWIPCSAWGSVAAVVDRLPVGSRVTVRGALRKFGWTNAEGEKRSRLEVVADSVVPEGIGLVKNVPGFTRPGTVADSILAQIRVEPDKARTENGGAQA